MKAEQRANAKTPANFRASALCLEAVEKSGTVSFQFPAPESSTYQLEKMTVASLVINFEFIVRQNFSSILFKYF